jgi:hypothetical protein
VRLAFNAEAEAVQLSATNSALDRLMGKPQQSVDMTTNGETLGYVIAAPPEVPEADEWATQQKPNLWGTVPKIAQMQSEGGAAGTVHGALQAGSFATTSAGCLKKY